MLAAHEVGNAVCTALLQQLFHELRQQRSAQSRARLGVETAIALLRCGCACRAWTQAAIPPLVLLLNSVFDGRTRTAAARSLHGLLRGQSGSAHRRLVAASDVLPPLLMMVQGDDATVAAAGAKLAAELGRECENECEARQCDSGGAEWDASILAVLPALTTAVSDAAAAAGAWPVRVVEHRPSLNPGEKGHFSVLDIRADAFDEPSGLAEGGDTSSCAPVFRQLVLGVWEPDGFRESEVQLKQRDVSSPSTVAGSQIDSMSPSYGVHVDPLSWYTRTSLAALLFQLSRPASCVRIDASSWCPRVLMLGLGGGTMSLFLRQRCPSLTVENVELEPLVLRMAVAHFGFPPPGSDKKCVTHICDAADFVARSSERLKQLDPDDSFRCGYDAVMVDLYTHGGEFPSKCLSETFVNGVAALAKDRRGVVVLNMGRSLPGNEKLRGLFATSVHIRASHLIYSADLTRILTPRVLSCWDRAFASTRLLVAPDDDPECTESEILLGSGVQTDIMLSDTGESQLSTPCLFPARVIGSNAIERANSKAIGGNSEAELADEAAAVAGPLSSSAPFSLARATQKTTGLANEETATHAANGTSLQVHVSDVWEIEWQTTARQDASVVA